LEQTPEFIAYWFVCVLRFFKFYFY
jgi:hypothetical protein